MTKYEKRYKVCLKCGCPRTYHGVVTLAFGEGPTPENVTYVLYLKNGKSRRHGKQYYAGCGLHPSCRLFVPEPEPEPEPKPEPKPEPVVDPAHEAPHKHYLLCDCGCGKQFKLTL